MFRVLFESLSGVENNGNKNTLTLEQSHIGRTLATNKR